MSLKNHEFEKQYDDLPDSVKKQWYAIDPSRCGSVEYRPCAVILKNGDHINNVYIIPAQEYINEWGVWPEDDSGKLYIDVKQIQQVEESLNRLPAFWANKIYEAGESGMGYHIYTLCFSDGSKQAYLNGGAVDFIIFPPGKSKQDIVDVMPHKGRKEKDIRRCPDYYWCLFGKGKK